MLVSRAHTRPAPVVAPPHVTHVLVCGATDAGVAIALLLRRLSEAVTVVAESMRGEMRRALEGAGVRIVIGSPSSATALAEARADEARAAIIAAPGDLACVETTLAMRAAHPQLPLICCAADAELAVRLERSLGARAAVCVSAIEAVHLAGCALQRDVVGAFALADDLVLLRRMDCAEEQLVGELEQRTATRVLMIEQRDGRSILAPSRAVPIGRDAVVTVVEHRRATTPRIATRAIGWIQHAARTVAANTPRALGWTAVVLALLAATSVFVFHAGMAIPLSDAVYLVFNTISTVGYGDITPFRSGPLMHVAGSMVALLGPALLGTLLLIFARVLLRPAREAAPPSRHVVIAAPPAIALRAAAHLARLSIDSAIASPSERIETTLRECNVRAARSLIAATSDPVANVTLSLGAREINPPLHTVVDAPAKMVRDMGMSSPAGASGASISIAAAAALVPGLRYAMVIGERVFSFFEGTAGGDWAGQRPSDVAGSYNFVTLFRRSAGGTWRGADGDGAFEEDEEILVAAWRRLDAG